jgi:outer membrane receptor protein involved in Fe transport
VVAIGTQANASIGIAEPALGSIPVGPLRGRSTARLALRRLLAGTAADLEVIDDSTFRIVPRVPRHARPAAPPRPPDPAPTPTSVIVVTASKRSTTLANYPGSVAIDEAPSFTPDQVGRGTDALVARDPILTSTHLGPGRNKVFIRGIADSSFNGPSQSTVGEYLGEIRLNYNAPDPDLALYDIASVEVLEGPQGTLYGAGALGGILRLVPVQPDLSRTTLDLSAGGTLVRDGAAGHDVAAVGNVPIATDRLGLRAVVYEEVDGGYIDDSSRRLDDINRTHIYGGRATLRYRPAADWTIDLGGVVQNINSRDGAYAQRTSAPLTRDSVIAQPFDNDYSLASLAVRHAAGSLSLVSTTSAVFHDVGSVFDASPSPAQPTRYAEDDAILLVSNETRLSRSGANGGGWVIGVQLLHSSSRIRRTLGAVGSEPGIAGTFNTVDEGSAYGEATLGITDHLSGTAGGRIAFDHLVGQVIDGVGRQPEVRRQQVSALPSAGLLWKARPRLALYARYQEGYRPGGLSVQSGVTQRFGADSVSTWEAGARYGTASDVLSATAALSYARWTDIQADLVDATGLPYVANIGSGRVLAIEARTRWRPAARLSVDASLLASDSSLRHPKPAFAGEQDATLPNVADLVARVDGRYEVAFAGRRISLSASASYVDKSRLGVGPALDIPQGRYLDLASGIAMPIGPLRVTIDASNLANARRNMFSFGNPFGVLRRDQITPLRPRSIRLGASVSF